MLMDFVDEIEKNLGRKAIRELVPMHPADTHTTWSDTTKLQKLGYDPTVSIAEGIEKFVSWYKDYYRSQLGYYPPCLRDYSLIIPPFLCNLVNL